MSRVQYLILPQEKHSRPLVTVLISTALPAAGGLIPPAPASARIIASFATCLPKRRRRPASRLAPASIVSGRTITARLEAFRGRGV